MTTLFVSDVHLHAERPEMAAAFLNFLDGPAREADALYILGDLFDIWLGDDDDTPPYPDVLAALKSLTSGGTPVTVFHGNRDFLMGERFATATGCEVIPDATVIDLYGTPTLVMHGDTLCTDDVEYQAMRVQVRNPAWQQQMLALPLEQRRELGKGIREEAKQRSAGKSPEIMDVTQLTVEETMREASVLQLIHGHTHRPADHEFDLDGQPARRFVLGDWYEQDSVLICDAEGCRGL